MPRRTHQKQRKEEEAIESISPHMMLYLSPRLMAFLDTEAKRLSQERGKTIRKGDVIRALIVAYYEKRTIANLLLNPDD
jgi:hypothetical protein